VASGQMNSVDAVCTAASIGGDTDTIAAVLGAMLGTCEGLDAWPTALIEQVRDVNHLQLEPLVEALLALRNA